MLSASEALILGVAVALTAGCSGEPAPGTGGDSPGAVGTGGTSNESATPNGSVGSHVAVSADGRFMAFSSTGDNLVDGDTNGVEDVFVYDRETDTNARVSVSTSGEQGDESSAHPGISRDGRFVTFTTYSLTLSSHDPNGFSQIYIHDRETGETEWVCEGLYSTVSDDGNVVSCSPWEAIVINRETGDVHEVDGAGLSMTADGSTLMYRTIGDDHDVVRIRDLDTGVESELEIPGREPDGGHISSGGRYVVFAATGPDDQTEGDIPGYIAGVYWYDRDSGSGVPQLLREVKRPGVKQGDMGPVPTVSEDGARVLFSGMLDDARYFPVMHLAEGGATREVGDGLSSFWPRLSANGEWVAYAGQEANELAHLHEIATGDSKLASKPR